MKITQIDNEPDTNKALLDRAKHCAERTDTCFSCGSKDIVISIEENRFQYGADPDGVELVASVPVHWCQSCGEGSCNWIAEEIMNEAVCHHLGRLTPTQIKE